MNDVHSESTVGSIVRDNPKTGRVFERFGIDFCCGGKRSLEEAVASASLDLDEVLEALRSAMADSARTSRERDCTRLSMEELVDHIVSTHHAYLGEELPRVGGMVEKVASVHGESHAELLELRDVYRAFAEELREHAQKEEQILFPAIREIERSEGAARFPFGSISNPIGAMEHEHDSAGGALKRMRELTDGFTPPAEACNTWLAMLEGLRDIEDDLHWHVHKENNVLFPLAVEAERDVAIEGSPD